ncbi:MAG: DUF3109 family protein [Ignavibacteriales bacterium]|nr:DUF3109 family protein [Ignavibacteriales bacterium]
MDRDFVEIDNVLINTEVLDTEFTCDLSKCKGACCTMESEYGAPVTKEEIEKIEEILPVVKKYLPKEHIREIEQNGFWIEKYGELMTRSLNNRACVFVTYEDGIAKCGIEKAYKEGKVDFIKPVSCHLFPIRISNFGGPVLRFEKYSECVPALDKGKKTKIKIIDFCRDAVEREYGKEWFDKTKEVVNQ